MSATFKTEEELSPYSNTPSDEDFQGDLEDPEHGHPQQVPDPSTSQLEAVPQKRKGGRKPVRGFGRTTK